MSEPRTARPGIPDATGRPIDPGTLPGPAGVVTPPGWVHDTVRTEVTIPLPIDRVWAWLDDPATFVDGQVPPYRVEFVRRDSDRLPGGGPMPAFNPGVRTDHHGPLLALPGVVGLVVPEQRRDLHYLYGAYVVSPRLMRPSLLRFELAPVGTSTDVAVTTAAAVPRWFAPLWRAGNRRFWRRFAGWAARAA
ncbi:MAG: hypothetical protein JJT89_11370 [Nitriliruptoraceae bacterium]|nr:hypothetical protein [Nitriliruptoraceae bacterium]